ncbi:MAG TPA: ABC transporter permease [Nitrospinota bacterium]|nr:ABC transporter permease [Nitrospinota bacterium]|tara:strand:+ start:59769 stop:60641 length:873 start_codon:yes stop_codon:yes gene_type:complete
MHGTVFPPIEPSEVISTFFFIVLLFGSFMTVVIANRFIPAVINVSFVKGYSVICLFIAIWEMISFSELVNPVLLPPASRVASMLVFLWSIGFLQSQIYATLYKLAYAFSLALASGVTLGVMISYYSNVFSFIESFATAARVIPAPAWLALSILWFGIGSASAIFIIWLGCFFPIFLNTVAGVAKVEPVQVETIKTFGGDKWDVLLDVVLPTAYHHILTGSRIGLGIGWITVVTAELASPDAGGGLGWMIMDSRVLLDITSVLCGVSAIGFLGVVTDSLLNSLEELVQTWG